jgi:RNA polymerase sigma-70 factor (ECF subfamily)
VGSPEPDPSELDALLGPASMEPDAILSGRQRLAAIEQVIARLPPRAREAFVLFKLDGLSRSEVAHAMGIGLRTVETHLEVAMTALVCELQLLDGVAPAAARHQANARQKSRSEGSTPND